MWRSADFQATGGRLAAALVMLLIILGGCGETPVSPQVSRIAWHCQEVRGSREPQCEQKQLVNGRPVAKAGGVEVGVEVAVEAEPKQVGDKGSASRKPREIIPLGEYRPRPWKQQLPEFTLDKPHATAPPVPTAYRDGPPPVPEPAFLEEMGREARRKETKPGDIPVDNDNMTAAPAASASAAVSSEPLMEVNPDENPLQNSASASAETQGGKGVTVQLGAFNSKEAAEQFIRAKRLAHLAIERQVLNKAGQALHILTFGDFADEHSAAKAWLAAAGNAEQIEVWIRPVRR